MKRIHLDTAKVVKNVSFNAIKAMFTGEVSKFGSYTEKLENELINHFGASDVILTNSGTTALQVALNEANVKYGEVILPSLTYVASENAIKLAGATPIYVDVDPSTWLIDPVKIIERITPKTKAIMPVHLYGNICDMDEIMSIAKEYNLKVIEDATEAMGSFNTLDGDYICYSFNGNKLITTGAGGAIVTKNYDSFREETGLRDAIYQGYMNGSMPNLNAAYGLTQLKSLRKIANKRVEHLKIYRSSIDAKFQEGLFTPWMIAATFKEPIAELESRLAQASIPTRRIFKPLKVKTNACRIYKNSLCLPSSYLNSNKQIEYICKVINKEI